MEKTSAFAVREVKFLIEARVRSIDQFIIESLRIKEPRLILESNDRFLDMLLICRLALFIFDVTRFHPDLPVIAQKLISQEIQNFKENSFNQWINAIFQCYQSIQKMMEEDAYREPPAAAAALAFSGQLGILSPPISDEVFSKILYSFSAVAQWWSLQWREMQNDDEEWTLDDIAAALPSDLEIFSKRIWR